MPVIHSTTGNPDTARATVDDMVRELAAELNANVDSNQPLCQPIILEQEHRTQALHVFVIWEKWRLIDAGERSRAIMQAYEQAAPDRVERITIAMAVTTDEAISLGLLPYGIVSTTKDGELAPEKIRTLMIQEGAVETPTGLLLRFPSQSAAELAWRRLTKQTSPEYWALVHTIRSGEES